MSSHIFEVIGIALLSSIIAATAAARTTTAENVPAAPPMHVHDGLTAADRAGIQAAYETAQQAYLKAANAETSDWFGSSLAVSGDTVVVGAHREDSGATGVDGDASDNGANSAGAAHVFVRDGTGWSQQAYLKASNTDPNDHFGWSVAISGDTIVVGAPDEASSATGVDGNQFSNGSPLSGAAYVFVRNGTTWSQQAYLKASNTGVADNFGAAVAVSGDRIVVGALDEDSNATGVNGNQGNNGSFSAGAAYVFVRDGTSWSQQAYLKASDTVSVAAPPLGLGDAFGSSVSVSGDTVVVGAPREDSGATGVDGDPTDNTSRVSGAAYVFVWDEATWSQQAYLKASNNGQADQFGWSVAASGDTVVVGAKWEDSSATGVDGDQGDDGSAESGAAYVFVRNGTTWSQQAYLKATSTDVDDQFGWSVAASGDRAVVGAHKEDSGATGVDGDADDDGAADAGAAYVFVRDGTSWSPQAYVKASNTDADDRFGSSVAVSGLTLAFGAPREDSSATGVNGDASDDSASGAGAAYVFTPSPWTDLGNGLAGTGGVVPRLEGDGALFGNDPATLALSDALPVASAWLVLGATDISLPFKGGVLVPSVDVLIPNLPVDVDGTLVLGFTWPPGVPSGVSLYYQYWIVDGVGVFGFAASNGLQSTAP